MGVYGVVVLMLCFIVYGVMMCSYYCMIIV